MSTVSSTLSKANNESQSTATTPTKTPVRNWVAFSSSSGQTFQTVWTSLAPETQSRFAGLFIDRQCGALDLAKEFLPADKIFDFSSSKTKEDFEKAFLEWNASQEEKPIVFLIGYFRLISRGFLDQGLALVNTHPSLLPAFPGLDKKVHEAAYNQALISGFSVHMVNENMDDGPLIFQRSVDTSDCKSADELRDKVRVLEQKYLPRVIDQLILTEISHQDRNLVTRELQNKKGFPLKCVD
ncbi:MAG: formyltransferase family protein [Bdellovibrionota bacterium]